MRSLQFLAAATLMAILWIEPAAAGISKSALSSGLVAELNKLRPYQRRAALEGLGDTLKRSTQNKLKSGRKLTNSDVSGLSSGSLIKLGAEISDNGANANSKVKIDNLLSSYSEGTSSGGSSGGGLFDKLSGGGGGGLTDKLSALSGGGGGIGSILSGGGGGGALSGILGGGGSPLSALSGGGGALSALSGGGSPLSALSGGGSPLDALSGGGSPLSALTGGGGPLSALGGGGLTDIASSLGVGTGGNTADLGGGDDFGGGDDPFGSDGGDAFGDDFDDEFGDDFI